MRILTITSRALAIATLLVHASDAHAQRSMAQQSGTTAQQSGTTAHTRGPVITTLRGLKDADGKEFNYTGEVVGGRPNGVGRATYVADSIVVMGRFRDGLAVGKDTIDFLAKGERFIGDLVDGRPHGRGVWTYRSGARYEGEFQKGKREGKGNYLYATGRRYEGDFHDDRIEGTGTWFAKDGGIQYQGRFVNNKPAPVTKP
jgi:hypothetical protein